MMEFLKFIKMKGETKVIATISFVKSVANVASQTDLEPFLLLDSSDMCIPKASLEASAIAMVKIPPITTLFNPVPELSPTISPRVVMIPEVIPKLIPFLKDSFIRF